MTVPAEERWIKFSANGTPIPERLLLAHARGHVLFITGAGSSRSAGLPDFRALVIEAYRLLDPPMHAELSALGSLTRDLPAALRSRLSNKQLAEAARYVRGEYDVVLGMLERRMDVSGAGTTNVRKTLGELVRYVADGSGKKAEPKPSRLHRALVRLADRGASTTIVTTNFDLLLEAASRTISKTIRTHALGAIPRPALGSHFSGVLHIHGALTRNPLDPSEFVVTDQDFGEFYLRRRLVADFIYDAARLFNLVLVGYSANDAPMRYLLNAVAADGSRFTDLKERFVFVGMPGSPDQVEVEDWKGRGITPIPYESAIEHEALVTTMHRWSELSPINGRAKQLDALVKALVKVPRADSTDQERDLFDHLYRRGAPSERMRLALLATKVKAEVGWLDAMRAIAQESLRGPRSV